jgi:hypothetical protein
MPVGEVISGDSVVIQLSALYGTRTSSTLHTIVLRVAVSGRGKSELREGLRHSGQCTAMVHSELKTESVPL